MPFYEYECPSCRYYLEVLQKITDRPLRKCPSCGKAGFKRLMSAPVFRLKGSGWYETDFKSDKESQRNLAGAEREEAADKAKDKDKAEGADAKAAAPEAGKAGDQKPAAASEAGAGATDKPAARAKPAERSARPAARSAKPAAPARKGKGMSTVTPGPKRARRAARPATRRKGRR